MQVIRRPTGRLFRVGKLRKDTKPNGSQHLKPFRPCALIRARLLQTQLPPRLAVAEDQAIMQLDPDWGGNGSWRDRCLEGGPVKDNCCTWDPVDELMSIEDVKTGCFVGKDDRDRKKGRLGPSGSIRSLADVFNLLLKSCLGCQSKVLVRFAVRVQFALEKGGVSSDPDTDCPVASEETRVVGWGSDIHRSGQCSGIWWRE
jgi:hypothetical protein